MDREGLPRVVARPVPEGAMPLIAIEGPARDCGRHYAEIVLSRYPGYRDYLDQAANWQNLAPESRRVIEARAPQIVEIYRGIYDVAGPPQTAPPKPERSSCTGFSLAPSATLDGIPISGQTKDTPLNRVPRYIVLRMKVQGAPTIMVLCYPGEVLGYGMWSTGMTITRHSMFASGGGPRQGLPGGVLPFAAMACRRVEEVVELYARHCGGGPGGMMFSDGEGNAASLDITRSAVGVRRMVDGILTRSNHPEAPESAVDAQYPLPSDEEDSVYRTRGLYKLFHAERGRLTAQKAYHIIADHATYPRGPCKHYNENGDVTTCLYVAEPTRGLFHVVRGQPCCNWPMTYEM